MEKSIDEEFPPLLKNKKKNNKRQDPNIFNTNYSHKNKISKADTQWHFSVCYSLNIINSGFKVFLDLHETIGLLGISFL
jgi:hypothetical protein